MDFLKALQNIVREDSSIVCDLIIFTFIVKRPPKSKPEIGKSRNRLSHATSPKREITWIGNIECKIVVEFPSVSDCGAVR